MLSVVKLPHRNPFSSPCIPLIKLILPQVPLLSIRSGLINTLASKKRKSSNLEVKLNIRTTAGKLKIFGILQASKDLPEPPKSPPGLASCDLCATFHGVSGLKVPHTHTHRHTYTPFIFSKSTVFVSTTLTAPKFFFCFSLQIYSYSVFLGEPINTILSREEKWVSGF